MIDIEIEVEKLVDRLAPIGVAELSRLTGGASSLSYVGTVRGTGQRVVVKVAPAGVSPTGHRDVLRQARALRTLHSTDVPVPAVVWEDAGDPPAVPPLFVMEFVDGTSMEPLFDVHPPTVDDGPIVAARLHNAARTLAALHRLQPDDIGVDAESVVTLPDEIDRWCELFATVDQGLVAGWQEAAATLAATAPADLAAAIVHGDFRLGNLLADGAHIAAVVDWEIWSLGDPRVDLGWFLLNAVPETYRRAGPYVGLLPSPTELIATYSAAVGHEVADVAWFCALGCFKSAATWSLIVKHNRRRAAPDPALEAMVGDLGHLLQLAHSERWTSIQ